MKKDPLVKPFVPVFLLLLVVIFSFLSLILGASWLERPLNLLFKIPIGNILVYFGLMSSAVLPLILLPSSSRWIYVARFVTVLTVCWLPLSIFIAGNVGLNFSNETQVWFNGYLYYTAFTAIATLLLLLISVIWRLYHCISFKKS